MFYSLIVIKWRIHRFGWLFKWKTAVIRTVNASRRIYLPVEPQVWKAVVDLQVAVRVEIWVVVVVLVVVEVPKASKKRPEPISLGAANPGWTT